MDMMRHEKLLTVGNDRSCRIWKIRSDSQLVFRAPTLSMECCRFLNSSHFVTGSADGLQLWNTSKKKPISCTPALHNNANSLHFENSWIQSLASIHQSDLVGSGAADGSIRLWRVKGSDQRWTGFERLGLGLEASGNITALHFSKDGGLVFGAQSKEPRLGNWTNSRTKTQNSILIYRLKQQ